MKKQFMILMAFIAACCLVSCSDSPDELSASKVEKLIKTELKRLNQLENGITVQTGYFECNDADVRYKYRQLAANELITYKCDKIEKPERVRKSRIVRRNNGWFSYNDTEYYWVNTTQTTYFVTIALTEKGQKLVMEEKEVEPTEDQKELREDMEIDTSKYPESNVAYEEFPNPAVQPEPAQVPVDTIANDAVDSIAVVEDIAEEQTPQSAKPKKELNDYEKAKAKENIEEVLLRAYELKIVKARNIEKTDDFSAKAEILFEYVEVTPVGRIFSNIYEGQRFLSKGIHYRFYMDKGWKLDTDN